MLESLSVYHPALPMLAGIFGLAAVAIIADLLVKHILVAAARAMAARSRATWDDALVQFKVFGRLAQLVPGLVLYAGIPLVPDVPAWLEQLARNLTVFYIVVMMTLAVIAMLSAANCIYEQRPEARERPIKGFIQLLQILVVLVGIILAVAALLDKSPLLLLSGLGAMTAVLMLVFKDTILSLVASVQLTTQDMVRVGDWIEMPQVGADGDVIDVELHLIRVQNWDKTITTIPTHRLISESFRNWRGMAESGGRRIKRALYIDQASIRFLGEGEVERFGRFRLLRDYVAAKRAEIAEYNAEQARKGADRDAAVNFRRLTNIGTFRAYVFNYLKNHPRIHQQMTLIVRQLPPGPQGLPIEIYCFTNTTNWNEYEDIQGDIFDHCLSVVPEFDLRLYQQPTGHDVAALGIASAHTGRDH